MSYSVDGKTITMTRGDTVKLTVTMKYKTTQEVYVPQEGDEVKFTMKKRIPNSVPIIEKNIPTDTLLLVIESQDTKTLPYGSYFYDVQLTFANGDVDTFIPDGTIIITTEVG